MLNCTLHRNIISHKYVFACEILTSVCLEMASYTLNRNMVYNWCLSSCVFLTVNAEPRTSHIYDSSNVNFPLKTEEFRKAMRIKATEKELMIDIYLFIAPGQFLSLGWGRGSFSTSFSHAKIKSYKRDVNSPQHQHSL